MELSSSGQAPPSQTRLRSEEDYTETSQSSSLWLELTVPQHDSSVRLTVDGNSVGWYEHNSVCHTRGIVQNPKRHCAATKSRGDGSRRPDSHTGLSLHYTSTATNDYIFWYKQDGTSRPQFILRRFKGDEGKTEDEFKERFSSTLNPTMKSAPLKIQELQLSDSAVYYCALRPTVTGSSRSAH
ncbi:hypothetical protein D4764_0216940 [Takifugu flavidus]|uniref:Ig-like domain-containing protein n=1 Tax=Takifugu flavidus TaxID=433684 RepID=A0A5C6MK00_9TELE|nr:hypothetical protein D4764_0216940 [Takifugu flavidus]